MYDKYCFINKTLYEYTQNSAKNPGRQGKGVYEPPVNMGERSDEGNDRGGYTIIMKKFAIAIAVVIMAAFAVPAFAAMNPFMDVPASHWAYDAVAQLAARGVISGYPDGTYKGAQPATRYEMASALARALAKVDMEKASKQDVEMLKKLIVEFKDELDALGVKVDKLDDRVKVLEGDIGGWSMSGQLRFDANFGDNEANEWYGDDNPATQYGKNQFNLNRYRIFLRKRINETTSFTARIGTPDGGNAGNAAMRWERYYITTKLPYDISFTVGRQNIDWEGDLGLYNGNDAYVGDWTYEMLQFKKDWGMANLQLVFARQNDNNGAPVLDGDHSALEQFMIAGLANFNINEKFRAGLMGYYWITDDEAPLSTGGETDSDLLNIGVYAGFAFTPAVELKALYYWQDQGGSWNDYGLLDDNANAWKVILDVKQEALKFTSVWLEYGQIDNHFARFNENANTGFDSIGASLMGNRPHNDNTAKMYGIRADQQWNDKWRTYVRYFATDYDTNGLDDATNWTFGVGYRLNPAVEFELAYDQIDYGNSGTGNNGGRVDDDHMIRFRTFVTF